MCFIFLLSSCLTLPLSSLSENNFSLHFIWFDKFSYNGRKWKSNANVKAAQIKKQWLQRSKRNIAFRFLYVCLCKIYVCTNFHFQCNCNNNNNKNRAFVCIMCGQMYENVQNLCQQFRRKSFVFLKITSSNCNFNILVCFTAHFRYVNVIRILYYHLQSVFFS